MWVPSSALLLGRLGWVSGWRSIRLSPWSMHREPATGSKSGSGYRCPRLQCILFTITQLAGSRRDEFLHEVRTYQQSVGWSTGARLPAPHACFEAVLADNPAEPRPIGKSHSNSVLYMFASAMSIVLSYASALTSAARSWASISLIFFRGSFTSLLSVWTNDFPCDLHITVAPVILLFSRAKIAIHCAAVVWPMGIIPVIRLFPYPFS